MIPKCPVDIFPMKKPYRTMHRKPSHLELIAFIFGTLKPFQGWLFVVAAIVFSWGAIQLYFGIKAAESPFDVFIRCLSLLGICIVFGFRLKELLSMPALGLEPDTDFLARLKTIKPDSSSEPANYGSEIVPHREEAIIRSDDVDRSVRAQDRKMVIDNPQRRRLVSRMRASAADYESALRCQFRASREADYPKLFFNESKLCLSSDLTGNPDCVRVFKARYFDSLLTNELCTRNLVTRDKYPSVVFRGEGIFPSVVDESYQLRLNSIADSLMANHIGVSTIAHTADGFLILWRQSPAAQQSQTLAVSTGSGSCDWTDLGPDLSLHKTIVSAMERELHEESLRRRSIIRRDQIAQTKILGFFRWVTRGGKPEFVGISKLTVHKSDLEPSEDEVDRPQWFMGSYPARKTEELVSSLNTVISRKDLSVSLWVNICCLGRAFLEDQPTWEKFLWPAGA